MKYVADDGIEFETEKECLEHERSIADIEKSFIIYDKKLNEVDNIDYCDYINVLRRAKDVANYLYDQYGIGMERGDIDKEGIYLYDVDGRFKYVDDLVRYHCEQARRLQRGRKRLLALSGKEDLA